MAEPIEFRIVQHLQQTLGGISVAGGYHYDVAALAVKLDPDHEVEALIAPDGPRPFVLIELGNEDWSFEPADQVMLGLPVTINWVSEATPTDDDSFLQTFFRGCADVEQAIAVDISRGGLASETRIVRRTPQRLGAQVWAVIDTRIRVPRTYGRPNG